MKREHLFLGLIILFFLFTRLFKITQIPASLYWDEASIGYNAYSLGLDGKDEWGSFLPVHFRAFGEFKLPVYIYSVVPFVKIFGLNALAVRLPAVAYTLGCLFLVYLLVVKITDKKNIGILAAFILSISPWLFIFSRTGYEATAGLFFFLLSIYLYILKPEKLLYFFLGTLFAVLSIYSYTSFRIIAPLTFFIFLVRVIILKIKDKQIFKSVPVLALFLLFFCASLIPIARLFIYDAGFGRAQAFALIPGFRQVYDLAGKPHLQITYNRSKPVNWGENILSIGKNYISHFSLGFLIFNGDANPRSQIPGHGELYLIDILLAISGIIYIIRKKKISFYLPLLLLLLAPIPAAITKESPHALRTILMAPSCAILSAFGIALIAEKFKKYSQIIIAAVVVVYLGFFEYYFSTFINEYPVKYAAEWQYGYKEIYEKYSQAFGNYQKIVISDEYAQPYIFALFYQKYNPAEFRKTASYNYAGNWGFSTVKNFGKFTFEKIADANLQKDSLIFTINSDKIENTKPEGEILNPDGSTSFWVYSK